MPEVCVALDVNLNKAWRLFEELYDLGIIFKIGPRLFLEGGGTFIEKVKSKGGKVFLDLKLHDIPNTVKIAVQQAEDMGVDYLTLHTLGGIKMMEWAASARESLRLIGVTLLTSHDEGYLSFLRTDFRSLEEFVLYLARKAQEAGLDGVVSSAGEVRRIKESTGLLTVVPGIRLERGKDDQVRVYTPREAVSEGADIVVVGREVYLSENPRLVVSSILEELGA